jgi:xylulokinase
LLAAVGDGAFKNIQQACSATISEVSQTPTDRAVRKVYDRGFPVYQQLYQSLKADFKTISALG